MKFAVTYATTDPQVGSNPLWHACLLLSEFNVSENKLEVKHRLGFYGLPAVTTNKLKHQLKRKIKLDVNLSDNHGLLRTEPLHDFDRGKGVHGITFELSDDQYIELLTRLKGFEQGQHDAINEYINGFSPENRPEPKSNYRIYAYEHLSQHILSTERHLAESENRLPRLFPFTIKPHLGMKTINLNGSHTCKTFVLGMLDGILSDEQIALLTEQNKDFAIPRNSGSQEDIYLHSVGDTICLNKNGKQVITRHAESSRLFWTIPPQLVIPLSQHSEANAVKVDDFFIDSVRDVVKITQQLEWLLLKGIMQPYSEEYRLELIERTREHYTAFAAVGTVTDSIAIADKISETRGFIDAVYANILHAPSVSKKLPVRTWHTPHSAQTSKPISQELSIIIDDNSDTGSNHSDDPWFLSQEDQDALDADILELDQTIIIMKKLALYINDDIWTSKAVAHTAPDGIKAMREYLKTVDYNQTELATFIQDLNEKIPVHHGASKFFQTLPRSKTTSQFYQFLVEINKSQDVDDIHQRLNGLTGEAPITLPRFGM